MFRIALCDDEPVFLRAHENMVHQILRMEEIPHAIERYTSVQPLEKKIQQYDLVLMDILLNGADGFLFIERLRQAGIQTAVIFCTSTQQYSLQGYSVYPVHYLVKPIEAGAMREAVLRAYRQVKGQKTVRLLHKDGAAVIALCDVLYMEYFNRLTLVHTRDHTFTVSAPLYQVWQDYFPDPGFAQCHKSFIVALRRMKNIRRQGILLQNEEEIPVGRKYYDAVYRRFTRDIL